MPCPYATLLGIPGQGVHAARVFGLSRNDILATIVLAALTTMIWKAPFWKSLLAWFVLGEVLHYFMGVDSAFLKMISLSPKCSDADTPPFSSYS